MFTFGQRIARKINERKAAKIAARLSELRKIDRLYDELIAQTRQGIAKIDAHIAWEKQFRADLATVRAQRRRGLV